MRALLIIAGLVLCNLLSACGGGDEPESSDQPDKTVGPVTCPASAPACTRWG